MREDLSLFLSFNTLCQMCKVHCKAKKKKKRKEKKRNNITLKLQGY